MNTSIMLIELERICDYNGITIINNQDETVNTPENRSKYLLMKLNSASRYAFKRRRGMSKNYTYEMFMEDDCYEDLIINMAYTSLVKLGSEGETSQSNNGYNRSYESGGLYLKSDIEQIVPLGGSLYA